MSRAELGQRCRELVRAASAAGVRIGTAESLTGGQVAAAIVAVPGASSCFEGGVVSYSHAVKTRVLGVPEALLAEHGAVHPLVAEAMARGAREALAVDWAVATTGVAGPEPHDGQAVGTVYLGISGPYGQRHERLALHGDRAAIRSESAYRAVDLLLSQITFPADYQ